MPRKSEKRSAAADVSPSARARLCSAVPLGRPDRRCAHAKAQSAQVFGPMSKRSLAPSAIDLPPAGDYGFKTPETVGLPCGPVGAGRTEALADLVGQEVSPAR